MSVLVLGADGYIGFPLCMRLANIGYNVVGVDNFLRRKLVAEVGADSATPIGSMSERLEWFERSFQKKIHFEYGDLRDYDFVDYIFTKYRPEAVVHLGEQASAPYSMIDVNHAVFTQTNNLVGTLNILYAMNKRVPDCHLVKMGSMGEYGFPNIDIPEGPLEVKYKGRKDTLPFPKRAFTDWYYWSKVHDSNNIMLACQIWGLRATDIMQGIVYGTRTEETLDNHLLTRFDVDAVFGTVFNRFCAQAVLGCKLTTYGKGGQKIPVIALRSTVQCLVLMIQNPAEKGEYRVVHQLDEVCRVSEIAERIKKIANNSGLGTEIASIENPRAEDEQEHYYNPVHGKLYQLGFQATHSFEEEVRVTLADLFSYKSRLIATKEYLMPKVYWTART